VTVDPERRKLPTGQESGLSALPADLVVPLVESLPVAICALDLSGRVICWNAAAAELLGRPAAEVLGHEAPGVDAKARAALLGTLARVRAGERIGTAELGVRRPDGAEVRVLALPAVLTGGDGQPVGVVAALLDVAERDHSLERELRRRNRFIETILDNLPIGLAVNALDMSKVGYVNTRFQEIYGNWVEGNLRDAESFFERICPDARDRERIRRDVLANGQSGEYRRLQWDDIRVTGRDGLSRIVQASNIPLPEHGLMISTVQDVTDRKLAEEALRESERRYQIMAESSPVGIFRAAPPGQCRYVNRRWREIAGMTAEKALADGWLAAVHPDDREFVVGTWTLCVQERRTFRSECRFKRPGGLTTWVFVQAEPVFDSQDALTGYIGSVTDISERKRTEEEIRQLAYYDALTRLPNRAFFLEQLRRALDTAHRNGTRVAILFCDLDNFKDVNDTLGHDKGDLLLKQIAGRLSACIRKGDTLSRLGGDEFVLLLPATSGDKEAVTVARKIKRQMSKPFDLEGPEVYSTPSIGIAIFPEDGGDVSTLLKHADMAMYVAKSKGRNRYQFFGEDMNRRAQERQALEAGLRRALAQNEFALLYQPQFDVAAGRLVGAEALLRWHHPERGVLLPEQVIPLADETGLIHPIGEWVLRAACTQAREWQQLGFTDLRVGVNLSGRQFHEPSLVDLVRRVLEETALPPSLLELEIPEQVLASDIEESIATLQSLRELGVHVAIDDFGLGAASFVALRRLPVNRLKIAPPFIADLATDPRAKDLAGAILGLAESLGLDAVAEGVETEAQLQVLRDLGCRQVQGFHFARPAPSQAITRRMG
jgi:diguanylate cyclase (GGDEF)-like protein/PAS domain S-box-containing protein